MEGLPIPGEGAARIAGAGEGVPDFGGVCEGKRLEISVQEDAYRIESCINLHGFSLPEFGRAHNEIAPVPALVKNNTLRTRPGCAECGEQGHEGIGSISIAFAARLFHKFHSQYIDCIHILSDYLLHSPDATETVNSPILPFLHVITRKTRHYVFIYLKKILNMDEWYYKGVAFQRQRRYNDAIQAYEKALAIKPQSPKAWYNKGNSLAKLRKSEEAIFAYNKAISYFPQFLLAYLKKGNIFLSLKKYDDAIKAYESALKIHPHFFDALYYKGLALEGLNRISDAQDIYYKVLEIDPSHAGALFRIGLILIRKRDYSKGIKMLILSVTKRFF